MIRTVGVAEASPALSLLLLRQPARPAAATTLRTAAAVRRLFFFMGVLFLEGEGGARGVSGQMPAAAEVACWGRHRVSRVSSLVISHSATSATAVMSNIPA